jgi:hypothetical protein
MSGRVPEQVKWAVETTGVALLNCATGAVTTLAYPQAAIWDFLTRGESPERIAALLCPIASLDEAAAAALVAETVAELRERGFLG